MRSMRKQQGGIYGVLFVLGVLGIVVMITLKVLPIYLNQMKIAGAVKQIADSPQYTAATVRDIRRDMQKRWDIEDVKHLTVKDVKIIKGKNGRALKYDYEVRVNLVANWDLVLWFKDQLPMSGRGS